MNSINVVTVTLNPALDLTGSLNRLTPGAVNIVGSGSLHPAGKGVNVAKVLADLGAKVTVTGFLGSDNQEAFVRFFDANKLNDRFLRVAGSTRINVKLVEQTGTVSDFNFPGVVVTDADLDRFERNITELMADHEVFIIAGSLPVGVPASFIHKLIVNLQSQGKKVVFDSSSNALAEGVKASPYLIKPNEHELSELIGSELSGLAELSSAAETLFERGCKNVVVSMGEDGVLWLDKSGWLRSTPIKVDVVSTVGAGDSLVAGLCWGMLNQWSKEKTLRFATAVAALAVAQVGVGVSDTTELMIAERECHTEVWARERAPEAEYRNA